jgi:hypothetical protein
MAAIEHDHGNKRETQIENSVQVGVQVNSIMSFRPAQEFCKIKFPVHERYPGIVWKQFEEPLGCAESSLGTTGLESQEN